MFDCKHLIKIADWCRNNRLSLNNKKKVMYVLGSRPWLNNINCMRLCVSNVDIDFVHQCKYLGVILNPNLNSSKHRNNIIEITVHKINLLAKIRQSNRKKC